MRSSSVAIAISQAVNVTTGKMLLKRMEKQWAGFRLLPALRHEIHPSSPLEKKSYSWGSGSEVCESLKGKE